MSGWLRKGPDAASGSHYYSEPHLQVQGEVGISGRRIRVAGNGWLDHEWADSLMSPEAVGWDWIGMNLDDGGALMATQWRRADGGPVWAHASLRTRSGEVRRYGPKEVRFTAWRRWLNSTTRASYPVEWLVETPAGRYQVRSRLDLQEVDARSSTANVYYEGLSDLLGPKGERLGSGYLEMTGYAGRLTL